MNTHTHRMPHARFLTHPGSKPFLLPHVGRVLALLTLAGLVATVHGANPVSVQKHKNGVSIRVQPLRLFENSPQSKKPSAPAWADATTDVARVSPMPDHAGLGTASATNTAAAPTVAATVVPPPPTPAPLTSPQLAPSGTNTLPRLDSARLDERSALAAAQTRARLAAEQARIWAMQQAARQAQAAQRNYEADVAGDLGAMGAYPW